MRVYLDHSATTATDPKVLEKMLPYFSEVFGNASSQHTHGIDSAKAVENARMQVAKALSASPNEIYFTSGGTESDNMAIRGVVEAYKQKGNHVITSAIEHHAVLETCKMLEKQGVEVTYLLPDSDGIISAEKVENAIKDNTILVSIMTANSEIGTIQPIREIGAVCREKKVIFHTDAVQAIGNIPLSVKDDNIDILSLSAHKFYGPKGVGAIYIRNGVKVSRLMIGGEQERKMRAGTYNTPGIVGLGEAITLACANIDEYAKNVSKLRDYLAKRIVNKIPFCTINGTMDKRLPGNLNVTFDFIEGESILLLLDMDGISASSGSACSSGSIEPSHVLLSIGVPEDRASGTIRFSLGRENTLEQIDYTVEKLKSSVEKLREISPLFKTVKGEIKNV